MGSEIDSPANLQSTSTRRIRAMASLNPSLHALPAATTPTAGAMSPGGGSECSAIHFGLFAEISG
jgi:hypothetical protein